MGGGGEARVASITDHLWCIDPQGVDEGLRQGPQPGGGPVAVRPSTFT